MTYTSNSIDIVKVSNGQSGQTLYTWIAYADDDKGTGFTTENSAGKKYIGIAVNKESQTESQSYLDYAWSKIQGEDGAPGSGISEVIISYQISDSQTEPPANEPAWSSVPIETTLDKPFLWTKTEFVYSEDKHGTTYSVSKASVSIKIESSQEEILKFYADKSNLENITYSPNALTFKVLQFSQKGNLYLKEFDYTLSIMYSDANGNYKETTFPNDSDFIYDTKDVQVSREEGEDRTITFDISVFLKTEFEPGSLQDAQNAFQKKDVVLKFTVISKTQEVQVKSLFCRFGNSQDMAKFSVNAADITASIQQAGLRFSADGLQLMNTNFSVLKDGLISGAPTIEINGKKYSKVLYADDSGNLTFQGNLKGASGDFTGEIIATSGTFVKGSLGNLKVTGELSLGDKIFINGQEGIRSSTNRVDETKGFSIGLDGKIIANELILGTSAMIRDYIQLGKARINNPSQSNNYTFIECHDALDAATLTVGQNGIVTLGRESSIILDGVNSLIMGRKWSITPDLATFSNAHISGTLSTTIFEKSSTKLSGGSFVFKNALRIESISEDKVTIKVEGNGQDYCKIGDMVLIKQNDGVPVYRKIVGFVETNIKVDKALPISVANAKEPPLIIFLGGVVDVDGKNQLSEWIIGVNSELTTDAFGTAPNTMTFSSLQLDSMENVSSTPEVIIGQVPTYITRGEKVIGLYAKSAYLTGSLTNIYEDDGQTKYAGINTESNVRFIKAPVDDGDIVKDTSRVVIWAGATATPNLETGELTKDVANAKFQVTSDGTLYASQAIFEGSVLTKAQIQADKLSGTDFYPVRDDSDRGLLRLHDTLNGIVFYEGEDDEPGLTIAKDAMFFGRTTDSNRKNIFLYSQDVLTTYTDIQHITQTQTIGGQAHYLSISETANHKGVDIGFYNKSTESNDKKIGVELNDNGLALSFSNQLQCSIDKERLVIATKNMQLEGDIIQKGQKVKEQRVIKDGKTIGYDVFIED